MMIDVKIYGSDEFFPGASRPVETYENLSYLSDFRSHLSIY